MHSTELIAEWISVIAALSASGLWFYSTQAKVKPDDSARDKDGLSPLQILHIDDEGNQWDILRTAECQVSWNKWAALAAGVAALSQAVAILAHISSN
jgi:hypothetical protein